MTAPATPRRIGVVGSGIAGLTAAYVASRSAHVTLLETDERLGGHADTHFVTDGATGRRLAIDTGFIVHNRRTYPVLLRLFDELGVRTQGSEMSMSIADEASGLEWAGALGVRGLFPTAANLRDRDFLTMLVEIPRFHRRARRLLRQSADASAGMTLAEFLDAGGFSPYFRRHFAEPLVAAVWSCDPDRAAHYPAAYLFTFLHHHGMLRVFGSPTWRTVSGGSRSYVDRVAAAVRTAGGEVRTSTPVLGVTETPTGVLVRTASGEETFDAVVVATHPHQALALLTHPTPAQSEILGELPYVANTALLHTDARLLPSAANARASWNFRRPHVGSGSVQVTYDLTRLQRLPTDIRYLVTLGGEHFVDPAKVIARRDYEHPLYTPTSVAARARLREADTARVVLAGAYHGWGFHEDGARSGLEAAERLGLRWPPAPVPDRAPVDLAPPRAARTAAPVAYATTITHRRRQPIGHAFRHRSHLWVVDLDGLPADGRIGRLRGQIAAIDHFTGRAPTVRADLDAFLARHDIDLRGGRVLMAAHARALGHCFNPISVFWCWAGRDTSGPPAATVVEVHNTYGDRHAYLVPADERGTGTVDKAMYVSPFHGTDGSYRVVAPPPTGPSGRLAVAVRLHNEDGSVFDASLVGAPSRIPLLPLAGLRGALLIRRHGVALWLRGLQVRPRPVHHQEGAR
ncbi:putative NAD/FAD-binding protein/DUF1365 family protein [Nocardioides thalensis]|uniref:Putative NAD/FAD-binding protein/DUF1365 family protein n=1 Tax=Nocardioides thalensis TaxID=1914755 RepID=A0A853C6Y8_9ACTN|nr:FAD-dependent oxidoreductase [Nocardioides thalensis]NYJ02238.1 putative NAD/FAD-binding protein/DUF1365 family protein [Nocardioides thalensis]